MCTFTQNSPTNITQAVVSRFKSEKRLNIQAGCTDMRGYRSYTSAIPRNLLKDKTSCFHQSKIQIPSPEQILHPFYSPTEHEQLIACFKEVRPALLDGRRIVPCLMTSSEMQEPRLTNCSLQFDSVRGVSGWLQAYLKSRSRSELCRIDAKQVDDLIKASNLDKVQHPQLKKLLELFGVQHTRQVSSKTLDIILDQLISAATSPIFCEDVYYYLLQHHVNSIEKVIAIVESIESHLHSSIDQFRVAETLVLQILISVQKNHLEMNKEFIASFDSMLSSVKERFHLVSCESQFQPLINQYVLRYYIETERINESKSILCNLITNGFLPEEKLAFEYLQLLDKKFGKQSSDSNLLKKFAYISDMRPIIESAQDSSIFNGLLKYCRHINEVNNLIAIIQNLRHAKKVLDGTLPSFIIKISTLGSSRVEKSLNLCSLYLTIMPYYNNKLPEKISKLFISKFAQQYNYAMVWTILEGQKMHESPAFILQILSSNEVPSRRSEPIKVHETLSKRKFIRRFLSNDDTKIDSVSRSNLLKYLKDSTNLM